MFASASKGLFTRFSMPNLHLDISRIFTGGQLTDWGRLPRYLRSATIGLLCIWGTIIGYLIASPYSYTSRVSLILPGSGTSVSMNVGDIGQASSYASSAFANNRISPTETYKRLLGADRILTAAAHSINEHRNSYGRPRIRLVDQTNLIHLEMTGDSPELAQARAEALIGAFFQELDQLRANEQSARQDSASAAIADYQTSVSATRTQIEHLQDQTGLIAASQYQDLMNDLDALKTTQRTAEAKLRDQTQKVATLEDSLGIPAILAAKTLKLYADGEFKELMNEQAVHYAALMQNQSLFGDNHPQVQSAKVSYLSAKSAMQSKAITITGLQEEMLGALDLAPDGARAELLSRLVQQEAIRAGLADHYTTISQQLDKQQKHVMQHAKDYAKLQDLERDFSVAEAVFASAIARSQSGKADVYASYPLVQVLENPSLPDHPISPSRKLAIAGGIAGTLFMFIGLFMGWIRHALVHRLLQRSDA